MKTPVAALCERRCQCPANDRGWRVSRQAVAGASRSSFLLLLATLLLTLPAHSQQLLIVLRIIEVPHATLTTLLADPSTQGNALHTETLRLAEQGKAEIVDTAVITARSGQRATVESFAEHIYPTEYEPPELPPDPDMTPFNFAPLKNSRPPLMIAFETRNAGPTLEVEPTLGANGLIDVRVVWEHTKLTGFTTWKEYRDRWGDGSTRMPIFTSQRINSSVTLLEGTYQLAALHNPTPAAIPEAATRHLIFVGAHLSQQPAP